MDNFDVVQALARTALGGNRDAVMHQIDRLAERLKEQGDAKEAAALGSLLRRGRRSQAIEPVSFEMSSHPSPLETLGTRTPIPVDRDTGAPLCEVTFPSSHRMPVLSGETKRAVETLMDEWTQRDALLHAGLPASTSLLLYGPPGTGKTTLARYLASELGLPSVTARLDGLISSLLGNTARNLASLFDFCNKYQTVLILDEFDAVAKVRDDPNEVGEIKRVVNALLQNLDRRHDFGLTVGITNHEKLLDVAIWRRFEHQIQLGLPEGGLRYQIAKSVLVHFKEPSALSKAISWATQGASGADVRTLAMATMKMHVIKMDESMNPIDLLRAAARGAASRISPTVLEQLSLPDQDLALALSSSGEVSFGVSELATVFGRDRRTMTRWLRIDGGGHG